MLHGSSKAVQHGGDAGTVPTCNVGASPRPSRDLSGAVVELAMFLTFDEVAVLESAAQDNGMTVARLLRFVIREKLTCWSLSTTGLENGERGGS